MGWAGFGAVVLSVGSGIGKRSASRHPGSVASWCCQPVSIPKRCWCWCSVVIREASTAGRAWAPSSIKGRAKRARKERRGAKDRAKASERGESGAKQATARGEAGRLRACSRAGEAANGPETASEAGRNDGAPGVKAGFCPGPYRLRRRKYEINPISVLTVFPLPPPPSLRHSDPKKIETGFLTGCQWRRYQEGFLDFLATILRY